MAVGDIESTFLNGQWGQFVTLHQDRLRPFDMWLEHGSFVPPSGLLFWVEEKQKVIWNLIWGEEFKGIWHKSDALLGAVHKLLCFKIGDVCPLSLTSSFWKNKIGMNYVFSERGSQKWPILLSLKVGQTSPILRQNSLWTVPKNASLLCQTPHTTCHRKQWSGKEKVEGIISLD